MNLSRTLALAILLSLTAACGSKPDEDSPLAFVPADTPYVLANLEGVPEKVSDPWFALQEPLNTAYGEFLATVRNDAANRPGPGSGERLLPLLELFDGKLSAQGFEAMGFRRDGLGALYGVGMVPVLRLELADEQAFRGLIAEIEQRRGEVIPVAEIDGQSYWRVASTEQHLPELVFAVVGKHLVVTLDFGAKGPPLPALLGLQRPEHSLLDSGELQSLNEEYGFTPYGTLLIDTRRLMGLLAGDAAGSVLRGAGVQMAPACRRELAAVAEALPRLVSGYDDLSAERAQVRMVAELRPDLAAGLRPLAAPVPGLGGDERLPFDFGVGIHLDKLAEFLQARAAAVAAAPYRCPWLAPLNSGGNAQQLAPLYMAAGWFSGARLALSELRWEGREPEAIAGVLVVASPNPAALIGMAQGFLPQLAGLDLSPGSEPQPVDTGAWGAMLPAAAGQPYIAVGPQALGVAVGEGAPAQLTRRLAAAVPEVPPLLHIGYDGDQYGALLENLGAMAEDAADTPPEARALARMQFFEDALREIWRGVDRVEFDVLVTERGLEIREQLTLK